MSMSTEKLEWKEVKDMLDQKWGERERKETISNGADYRSNWVCCYVKDNDFMVIHRYFKTWWNAYFKKYPNMGDPACIERAFKRDFPYNYYIQSGYDMYWLVKKEYV